MTILFGAGLSGLILSHKIINDRYFDNKSVLIIDKDLSHRFHKTYVFGKILERINPMIILSKLGVIYVLSLIIL